MKFILKLLVLAILAVVTAISLAFAAGSPAIKPFCGSSCQAQIESTVSHVQSSATIQDLLQSSEPAEVWGNSGIMMFKVAARVTDSRNPAGQVLTTAQKKSLRPLFGGLVD
jgi:hypothetical protein